MTGRLTAWAGALVALALAATLAAAQPAKAADRTPPYYSSSQPGGHELYGVHEKQTGATTRCSLGLQRNSQGLYRWWGKCQGNGRPIVAIFSEVLLVASPNTWGPTTVATPSGPTVYAVGGWHKITDLATVSTKVHVSYATGTSTGYRCLDSYTIRKGQRASIMPPRSGC